MGDNRDLTLRVSDASRDLARRNVTTDAELSLRTTNPQPAALEQAREAQLANRQIVNEAVRPQLRSDVNDILDRAGFTRNANGALVVRDTASLGRTPEVDGLNNAQQVYGGSEANLRPAAPPRVQVNDRARVAAQSFASNLDRVFDGAFMTRNNLGELRQRNVDELSADQLLAEFLKTNINDPNNNPETHHRMLEFATNMRQLGIQEAKKRIEVAQQQMKEAQAYAQQAEMIGTVVQVACIALTVCTFGAGAAVAAPAAAATTGAMATATATASAAASTAATAASTTATAAANSLSAGAQAAVNAQVTATTNQVASMGAQATQEGVRTAVQTGAQNITNTIMSSGNPAIQNSINTIGREATERMVMNQVQSNLSQHVMQQVPNQVVQGTLQSNVMSSFGQMVNMARPHQTLQMVGLATSAGGQVVAAGAENKATHMMLDAKETRNNAERFRLMADMHQRQIEEQNEAIKTIMESKNQTVDAVMQMLNASFASQQRLLSATMGRG